MRSNQALTEAFPLEDPESAGPQPYVHEGGGEDGVNILASVAEVTPIAPDPETYEGSMQWSPADQAAFEGAVVEHDLDEGSLDEGAADIEEEPENLVEEPADDGETTAKRTIRRIIGSATTGESTGAFYGDDDQHRRGGGGGWAFREFLRIRAEKEQAKSHQTGCHCEYCLG